MCAVPTHEALQARGQAAVHAGHRTLCSLHRRARKLIGHGSYTSACRTLGQSACSSAWRSLTPRYGASILQGGQTELHSRNLRSGPATVLTGRVESREESHIADSCLGLGSGVVYTLFCAQAKLQWNTDIHARLAADLSAHTAAPPSCLRMGKKGKGATRVPSGSGSTGLGGCGAGGLQDRLLQKRVEAYCQVCHSDKPRLLAKRTRTCHCMVDAARSDRVLSVDLQVHWKLARAERSEACVGSQNSLPAGGCVQAHDCVAAEALAEHLRQVHKEYQRRKASVFVQQVARCVAAASPPLRAPSAEQRLQVRRTQAPLHFTPGHCCRGKDLC